MKLQFSSPHVTQTNGLCLILPHRTYAWPTAHVRTLGVLNECPQVDSKTWISHKDHTWTKDATVLKWNPPRLCSS